MARTDWTLLKTAPAAEYCALAELGRLDLSPVYLPQGWRPHAHLWKLYPQWATIILVPIRVAESKLLRAVGGLSKPDPVLRNARGAPIRIPAAIVARLALVELRGFLDDRRSPRAGTDEIDQVAAAWVSQQILDRADADRLEPEPEPVDSRRVAAA